MRRPLIASLAILQATAALACDTDVAVGTGPSAGREFVAVIPARPSPAIDLLLVVDDSASMGEEQEALASLASSEIAALFSELPSLHVGVTTTDMGGDADASCRGAGYDGALQRGDACGVDGRFLSDVRLADGNRLQNYQGTLDETLGCMVRVGNTGCGFEQPLRAALRALENPSNGEFRRDDALLAVLVVSDEDDCSAGSDELFASEPCDEPLEPSSCPLGGLSSFRCLEQSVTCDQPTRSAGPKSGCEVLSGSGLMRSPRDLAEDLRQLAGGDGKLVVGALAPPADPVAVEIDSEVSLVPACTSALGAAAPAPRLTAWLGELAGQSVLGSICDGVAPGLGRFAALLRDAAEARPCLRGALADISEAPGVQPDCAAFDVSRFGTDQSRWAPVDFELELDPACAHTETGLAVKAEREVDQAPSNSLVVECRTLR